MEDFDWVCDTIHIGSLGSINEKTLSEYNIKHVLSITNHQVHVPAGINHKQIYIHDTEDEDISRYFDECYEFLSMTSRLGEDCIVHCRKGKSRSAAIVMAYLIRNKHMNFEESYDFLKKRRACIDPNRGFTGQLHFYANSKKLREQQFSC